MARGSVLAVSLLVAGWFALGIRQAQDTQRATAILAAQAPLSATAASHVRSLLGSAGWLNPDSGVDLLRGQLVLRQGDTARAVQILEGVTRREPMNLTAWVDLAQAALHSNGRVVELAIANIGHLDPRIK